MMIGRRSVRLGMAVGLLSLVLGCATSGQIRSDAQSVSRKITQARDAGAARCAPAELARAETNLEFMSYELDTGDARRAELHYRAALASINRALERTNPDECGEKRVVIAEPLDQDGDGLKDDVDKCPEQPEDQDGFEDQDGCPDLDNDQDGIPDHVDKCPNDPEDKDGVEDDDGCPDTDNDKDGVLDVVDACPNEAGVAANNGCPARDRDGDAITDDIDQCPDVPGLAPTGCPKNVLVIKTDTQIQIKKQIKFKTNKAVITGSVSFEILDQVAAVLKSNPTIDIVIEGHTDSVGNAKRNLKLSDSRAQSVREALIERGVETNRLQAAGFGKNKPIMSNKTAKGRAANRRVEFNITQAKPTAEPKPAGNDLPPLPPPP